MSLLIQTFYLSVISVKSIPLLCHFLYYLWINDVWRSWMIFDTKNLFVMIEIILNEFDDVIALILFFKLSDLVFIYINETTSVKCRFQILGKVI